jgi:hypothetical protein
MYVCMYIYIYYDEGGCEEFRGKSRFTTGINVHICVCMYNMFMCVYVYLYICIYLYVCIYIYVDILMRENVRYSGVRAVLQQV